MPALDIFFVLGTRQGAVRVAVSVGIVAEEEKKVFPTFCLPDLEDAPTLKTWTRTPYEHKKRLTRQHAHEHGCGQDNQPPENFSNHYQLVVTLYV